MFTKHQTRIGKFMLRNPENTKKGILVVASTIQVQTNLVMDTLTDYLDKASQGKYAWKMKQDTYDYVEANKTDIHKLLKDTAKGKIELHICLAELTKIDGLGIVKAGFVMQMALGKVGCLDTHNLARFGIDGKQFKFSKSASDKLRQQKASNYIDTCDKIGGCEYLWNTWCEFIADKYPQQFKSGMEVSALHCKWVGC